MKHGHHIRTVNLAQASQEEVVLVVDDDSIDREVVEAILEQPDRRFIKVESGQQALRDQPVSVVLLDVQMPVMDGSETPWTHSPGQATTSHLAEPSRRLRL